MLTPRWLLLGLAAGLLGCAASVHLDRASREELVLRAPGARQVFLATSLDGYAPRPARRGVDGTWRAAIPADREFRYFYIVDGQPVVPDCARRETDDFGGADCIHSPPP